VYETYADRTKRTLVTQESHGSHLEGDFRSLCTKLSARALQRSVNVNHAMSGIGRIVMLVGSFRSDRRSVTFGVGMILGARVVRLL
jgi:hypothetical protein